MWVVFLPSLTVTVLEDWQAGDTVRDLDLLWPH